MMKNGNNALTQSLIIWNVLPTRLTISSASKPGVPYVQVPLYDQDCG